VRRSRWSRKTAEGVDESVREGYGIGTARSRLLRSVLWVATVDGCLKLSASSPTVTETNSGTTQGGRI